MKPTLLAIDTRTGHVRRYVPIPYMGMTVKQAGEADLKPYSQCAALEPHVFTALELYRVVGA